VADPTDADNVHAPSDPDAVALPGSREPTDPSRALSPGRGVPREYVEKVQRERLIDAFVLLAAEKGIEAAGVRGTCQRAGVAFNTFYDYFESKDQLFLAAFDSGVELMFKQVSDAFLAGDVPWATRFDAGVSKFLEILATNPPFARFFAVESRKVGEVGSADVDRAFEQAFAMFAGARSVVDLPLTSFELAQMAIGAIFTPIYWRIRANRIEELPELGPKITAFVLALFDDQ